jgi:hypothetical protein
MSGVLHFISNKINIIEMLKNSIARCNLLEVVIDNCLN